MDSIQRACSIENCNKPYLAQGYCSKHYSRNKRNGHPLKVSRTYEITGLPRDSLKNAWINIKSRCLRPTHPNYHDYGDRGITICERWKNSYLAFYEDMAPRPEKHTIDRKDNDGNYSCGKCTECIKNGWPMNCHWVVQMKQVWNQRMNSRNSSGYRGVTLSKDKYIARYHYTEHKQQRYLWLGYYDHAEEAAIAYDIACIFFRGSEAKTNIL